MLAVGLIPRKLCDECDRLNPESFDFCHFCGKLLPRPKPKKRTDKQRG